MSASAANARFQGNASVFSPNSLLSYIRQCSSSESSGRAAKCGNSRASIAFQTRSSDISALKPRLTLQQRASALASSSGRSMFRSSGAGSGCRAANKRELETAANARCYLAKRLPAWTRAVPCSFSLNKELVSEMTTNSAISMSSRLQNPRLAHALAQLIRHQLICPQN